MLQREKISPEEVKVSAVLLKFYLNKLLFFCIFFACFTFFLHLHIFRGLVAYPSCHILQGRGARSSLAHFHQPPLDLFDPFVLDPLQKPSLPFPDA